MSDPKARAFLEGELMFRESTHEFDGRVSFCVGTGRCGTTFLAEASFHERLRLAATFPISELAGRGRVQVLGRPTRGQTFPARLTHSLIARRISIVSKRIPAFTRHRNLAILLLGLLTVVSLVWLLPSRAADSPAVPKKVFCPVIGLPECPTCACPSGYCPNKPHEKLTLAYKGGKLQFCCQQCQAMFQKTPTKFAANANHQLLVTGQAHQEKCPLCGGKIDPTTKSDLGGVSVQFCTLECLKKATAAKPADRMTMLFGDDGFAKGFKVTAAQKD